MIRTQRLASKPLNPPSATPRCLQRVGLFKGRSALSLENVQRVVERAVQLVQAPAGTPVQDDLPTASGRLDRLRGEMTP